MSQSTTMTIRMGSDLKERLDQLSQATHRSKSFLATEAIREFVDLNEWQISETQIALKEADEGDFASDEQVNNVLAKWNVNGD